MSNSGALSKQAAQTFASRAEVPLTTQCVCTVCVSELPPQLLSLDEVKQIYGPVLDKQVCGSGLPAPPASQKCTVCVVSAPAHNCVT